MENITLPDSITSIGKQAFYYCSSLKSITIPDGVTSIGDYSFCLCSSLKSITIPSKITEIGNSAFYGCTLLDTVNYKGSKEQWEKININSSGGNYILEEIDIIYDYK